MSETNIDINGQKAEPNGSAANLVRGNKDTYEITGRWGRASKFGGVLTAKDSCGRCVTIKLLERHAASLPQVLDRLATVSHPGVASVREWFNAPDGRLCIVRDMVQGTDLKTIFANKKVYGKIAEDQYVAMGCAVLEALTAVHKAGIVHRDVKPSNIVIRHEPGADLTTVDLSNITLIDFEQGCTIPTDDTARTQFALIYSPPEMLLKYNHLVGPHADLFALAITIYHLVIGKTPYTDCNPEVLINLQLTYPMKKPSRMTDELFAVLSKAAAKAPFRLPPRRLPQAEIEETLRAGVALRYADAQQMLADLKVVPHALKPANWWQRTFG